MFKERKRNFAGFAVVFLSIMLILTASMPNYFAYATGETYSEAEISEANKALDDFLAGKNSYLITNGGTWNPDKEYGRLKSDDGLTYTIGYKMSVGSEADFTSLNFNFSKFDKHRATVFFEGSALDAKTAPNGTRNVIKIRRRPKTQDIVVNARLALFRKSSINTHVQQGKVDPIAQRNIRIILKAPKSENAPVRVSVKAFDKDSNQEISKASNNLAVNVYEDQALQKHVYNLDAKYDYNMDKNRTYYISAKADGYEDYLEAYTPTEAGVCRVLLSKKAEPPKETSIWDFDKNTKTLKGFKGGDKFNNPAVLDIPGAIDGVPVEKIDKNAFKFALWGSNIKNQITELRIPASVKTIDSEAFKGHKTLIKMSFEENSALEKIGDSAFMSASLDSLVLPSSVKEVGDDAFSMNNITSLTLREGLEKLGKGAFGCNLIEKVSIPSTVKEFPKSGNGVFYKNFSKKIGNSAYKGQLRYVQVFDKSGNATAYNTGGVVNPVPVTIKYVNQFGESIREDEVVCGCNYQTTYEQYGKVTLGKGDKSFLKNYNGSNGTNSGNTATEIFKQEKFANAIIGENYFREGQEYVFSKDSAPFIKDHVRPQEDIRKTITSTENVVEYVYQTKEKIVVDKTELEKTIKEAERLKKDIKLSIDGKDIEPTDKWTTAADVKILDNAIESAKKIYENKRVRQVAVDKAKGDLEEAMKVFEESFKLGTKEQPKPEKPKQEPEKKEPGKTESGKSGKVAEGQKNDFKTGAYNRTGKLKKNFVNDQPVQALEKATSDSEKTSDKENAKQTEGAKQKEVLKEPKKKTVGDKAANVYDQNESNQAAEKLPIYVKLAGAVVIILIAGVLYKVMTAKQK